MTMLHGRRWHEVTARPTAACSKTAWRRKQVRVTATARSGSRTTLSIVCSGRVQRAPHTRLFTTRMAVTLASCAFFLKIDV